MALLPSWPFGSCLKRWVPRNWRRGVYDEDRPEDSRYPVVACRLDMNDLHTGGRVLPSGRVYHIQRAVGADGLPRSMHRFGRGLVGQDA